MPTIEAKSYEPDAESILVGGQVLSGSKVITGASEILTLLRVLGEGFRLACLYRSQVLIIASAERLFIIYIHLFTIFLIMNMKGEK